MDDKLNRKNDTLSWDKLIKMIISSLNDIDTMETKTVEQLNSCACLCDLGCNLKEVKTYIEGSDNDIETIEKRIKILKKYRKINLMKMHEAKQKLDSLQWLLTELKK